MICVEASTATRAAVGAWSKGCVHTLNVGYAGAGAQHDALELTDYKTSSGGQCSLKNAYPSSSVSKILHGCFGLNSQRKKLSLIHI